MLCAENEYLSICEAQKAFAEGKTTVKTLVQQYLTAIKELDPKLNAITVLNEHALEDAEKLDVRAFETLQPDDQCCT